MCINYDVYTFCIVFTIYVSRLNKDAFSQLKKNNNNNTTDFDENRCLINIYYSNMDIYLLGVYSLCPEKIGYTL